jgi:signal transduction histidine kinase/ActR/RegA family two-component response regulator
MAGPTDKVLFSPSPIPTGSLADGIGSLDEALSCIRDIIALSTLPGDWMGAGQERIAESALEALHSTLHPALAYVCIPSLAEGLAPAELVYLDGGVASPEGAERLGKTITAWAAEHGPDQILELSSSRTGTPLRVSACPLGRDSSSGVLAAGFADLGDDSSPTLLQRTLLRIAANQLITACGHVKLQQQAQAARNEIKALYDVSRTLAAELDLQAILQKTTDAVTRLTQARFGAFFHNVVDEQNEAYLLYTLSGAPREAFEKFGMPRNTLIFEHTFRGKGPVRLEDVLQDPRYGKMAPHHGMPEGHLPVRSYLAVPVKSRTGEVFGGLFLGHPEPNVFTERAERIATGIAQHAAVALDLYRVFEQQKRAEEELREADRRKDEFLATLAHELRNPLAPIRTEVTLLEMCKDDPARVDNAISVIDRQSSQLVRLVDDLLDVSRISRGKIALRRERVELASLIEHATEGMRPLCRRRDIELSLSLPEQPVVVDCDPVRVVQIVGNLLNNACKYTERGGRIDVLLERDGNEAVVRVRDDGIGIEAGQLSRIFDMFMQLEHAMSRGPGGLGIGLSLASSLAIMHGGAVEAHSEGLGKGSEFRLRLPALSVDDEAPPPWVEPELAIQTRAVRRRIVAVDDYEDALESLAALLELTGHEVHTASDGEQALEIIEAQRPDVVILDIGLPGLNGYEVARRIRGQPWGRELLLIAMTGWGQDQDKQKAVEAGFDAHLTKPASSAALARLLRNRGDVGDDAE